MIRLVTISTTHWNNLAGDFIQEIGNQRAKVQRQLNKIDKEGNKFKLHNTTFCVLEDKTIMTNLIEIKIINMSSINQYPILKEGYDDNGF